MKKKPTIDIMTKVARLLALWDGASEPQVYHLARARVIVGVVKLRLAQAKEKEKVHAQSD
jgi:hypothetical protein